MQKWRVVCVWATQVLFGLGFFIYAPLIWKQMLRNNTMLISRAVNLKLSACKMVKWLDISENTLTTFTWQSVWVQYQKLQEFIEIKQEMLFRSPIY